MAAILVKTNVGEFKLSLDYKNAPNTAKNFQDLVQSNKRGTIAMARTSAPHSASTQFFVNLVDNGFLDYKNDSPQGWGYCVFGEVTEGMEVVDEIAKVQTSHQHGHGDVPVTDIMIEKASIID